MLSFKQHKLCFWRFCTGSVVKNFFNIKYSFTGGALAGLVDMALLCFWPGSFVRMFH